jgi:hypothetical protein
VRACVRACAESDWCGAQTYAIAVPYTNHEHPPDLSTGIPALCHSAACRFSRCGNAVRISVRPTVRVLFIAFRRVLRYACLTQPVSSVFRPCCIQGGPRLAANWPRLMVAFHGRGAPPAAPAGALARRGRGGGGSGTPSTAGRRRRPWLARNEVSDYQDKHPLQLAPLKPVDVASQVASVLDTQPMVTPKNDQPRYVLQHTAFCTPDYTCKSATKGHEARGEARVGRGGRMLMVCKMLACDGTGTRAAWCDVCAHGLEGLRAHGLEGRLSKSDVCAQGLEGRLSKFAATCTMPDSSIN